MSNNLFRQILNNFFKSLLWLIDRLLSLCWTLILLCALSLGSFTFWAVDYFKSPGPLKYGAVVVIPEGSPLKSVSVMLAENNVITYPEIFTLIIRVAEFEKQALAGEYAFTPHMSPFEVFSKISSGDVVVRNFTIAEGLMTSQIIDLMNKNTAMTGEIPVDIAEGLLLPETYGYYYGEKRSKIIERMKRDMQEVLDKSWDARAENLPFKDKNEALVLASIVEKETGKEEERKRVAAVFINRLRDGMKLQTDPTVIYAITEGKYVLDRPLTFKDLETPSPFNTYANLGLPPSPIANPGKASIEAVMHPLETDEFFFVADGTGGHTFSAKLKDHNKNVTKWRKINKKKPKK